MQIPRRTFLHLAAGAAALPVVSRGASAQAYPSQPVRFIVSFAAGGPNDVVARIVAQFLSERMGQQFVVENRTGAGGNIGMASVLSAPSDGYTIGFATANNAINATLYEKLPFDFIRDSAPVGGMMILTNVMAPSVPAKTVAEFISCAKANPGKVNFGSGGSGTSIHLAGELFKAMTGIDMVHVPYRGSGPAMTDLLAGRLQVMFDNLPGAIEHIRAGRLRALAVTVGKRWPSLPDVPTVGETVQGFETSLWYGVVAPRATPPEIVDQLNATLNDVLADARLQARFADLGGAPMPTTPAQFGKLIVEDTEKWAKVVKFSGAKAE